MSLIVNRFVVLFAVLLFHQTYCQDEDDNDDPVYIDNYDYGPDENCNWNPTIPGICVVYYKCDPDSLIYPNGTRKNKGKSECNKRSYLKVCCLEKDVLPD